MHNVRNFKQNTKLPKDFIKFIYHIEPALDCSKYVQSETKVIFIIIFVFKIDKISIENLNKLCNDYACVPMG